ncbi:permease [Desulfovibrio sp. OttesenSCG-928-C06]|nr:permease [Desulfovibrio sp. OttesenSCG-928-C06]
MQQNNQQLPMQTPACCSCRQPDNSQMQPNRSEWRWNLRYLGIMILLAALWWLLYSNTINAADWLTHSLLGLERDGHTANALEFFLYDSAKILLLLVALIYVIGWLRAALNVERVRDFLGGKRRALGYFLGSTFGAITPFCSCSSIPLFLGFTTAGIPIGITMSFLITSPLINEIAVVLLWGLLGWKFTLVYVAVGMLAGIIGGLFMDSIRAGRWLQPFILEALESMNNTGEVSGGNASDGEAVQSSQTERKSLSIRQRHNFAYGETKSIFKRVWKWVFIGVGLGAALHGYVPENWFAENLGAGEWWTVPLAVLVAIPLYSNVTGIIPVMQSLLVKGMPIGTTLAFCMSSVAASLPEVLMLRQIMTIRLQAAFIGYLWVIFTLTGWLFNLIGPYIR